ncbi:MAG: ImmA/IrrE family metallo-endopeptidase [Candidatus Binataceae bacterium]
MAKQVYWTHPSVRALVESTGGDPVEAITRKAVEISLWAMQKGWAGPPFDPFALAGLRGIRVEPREDIADARTVPSGSGLAVEFNPNRTKARVRYSVCHEIAHTLFPDCRERVRNRLSHATMKGDDWQLEMLCNLAAAEFAMPIGTMPEITEERLDIDHVLELREKYGVSVEAMLLRLVKLTEQQCGFFCASRAASEGTEPRYLVNYAKWSRTWPKIDLECGTALPRPTVVADCTAIGFTARGNEEWAHLGRVKVESVGVAPYPSEVFPRVLGLLRPARQSGARAPAITYLKGDASEPRGGGTRLLVQVVNDSALTWGGGFSLMLRKKWPSLQQAFRRWAVERGNLKLGNVHLEKVNDTLYLASMVAQHGYGQSLMPRIRYLALRDSLHRVGEIAAQRAATVHMPRIGCGLAGGSWNIVGELVAETMYSQGTRVFVYDLPTLKPSQNAQTALRFAKGV